MWAESIDSRIREGGRSSHAAAVMIMIATVTALGCTGLDPVQPASGGTWYVGYHTGWGRYSETEEMDKALKAASDYCLTQGQQMSVIDAHTRAGGASTSYASVHFRCALTSKQ